MPRRGGGSGGSGAGLSGSRVGLGSGCWLLLGFRCSTGIEKKRLNLNKVAGLDQMLGRVSNSARVQVSSSKAAQPLSDRAEDD
jgi:hypothetical protein